MTYANSRIPESAQADIHTHLAERVRVHLIEPFRKPVAEHNREGYARALAGWDGHAPLVLDAGCGVGHSTIELARRFPDHWVMGIDQSEDRLVRKKPYPDALLPANLVFARADLVDFWRLLVEDGLRLARHYILYPNPWPKIGHLGRRWHAHPVFPFIPRLGGVLECRSNWRVYVAEFAEALNLVTGRPASWGIFEAKLPLTPFERKYRDSGQTLYRLIFDFEHSGDPYPEELVEPGAEKNPAPPRPEVEPDICTCCGACCAAYRVDFHASERGPAGVPADLCVPVTDKLYRMRGTDAAPPRCVALQGEIGRAVACAIYANRPSPCRDFAPYAVFGMAEDACVRARARHRLPPLGAL